MKRLSLPALAIFAALVAVAYAAAPTATVTDVSDSSVTIGTLKCATNYRFAVRTVNANGTTSAATVLNQKTDACPTPPPPPLAACGDGIDNDGDGLIDSADPGCTSPSDTDETDPVVGGGGTEPAPIAGQGYHEAFRDDFNTLDRSVWDDHIWYDETPNPLWVNFQTVDANGVLHLQTKRSWIGDTGQPYPYNTITTQSSGKTWQYGYFEARMKWSGGHGTWPGFWLFSYRHATNDAYPKINPYCAANGLPAAQCYSGEIDAFEGQGSETPFGHGFYGTIHRNSCDCYGVGDQQNDNNWTDVGFDMTADFHTYGLLWTPTTVSWYLDGRLLASAAAYDSLNQPMFLLFQMWVGGWSGDTDSTTPDTISTDVDYVSVWQQ